MAVRSRVIFPILVRTADKQQMAHAFGLIYLPPYVATGWSATNPFTWFWGNDQGQQLVGRPGDGGRGELVHSTSQGLISPPRY